MRRRNRIIAVLFALRVDARCILIYIPCILIQFALIQNNLFPVYLSGFAVLSCGGRYWHFIMLILPWLEMNAA